jgi:hypothetical protein
MDMIVGIKGPEWASAPPLSFPLSLMPAPKCSQPRELGQQKEFHIAPMLDVSTIEFRYFMYALVHGVVYL